MRFSSILVVFVAPIASGMDPGYTLGDEGRNVIPVVDRVVSLNAADKKPRKFRPMKWIKRAMHGRESVIGNPMSDDELEKWEARQVQPQVVDSPPAELCDAVPTYHIEYTTVTEPIPPSSGQYPSILNRCDRDFDNWGGVYRLVDHIVSESSALDYRGDRRAHMVKLLEMSHAGLGYWGVKWWKDYTEPCTLAQVMASRSKLVDGVDNDESSEVFDSAFRHIGACMVKWLMNEFNVSIALKKTEKSSSKKSFFGRSK
jgi:hypothetical protein